MRTNCCYHLLKIQHAILVSNGWRSVKVLHWVIQELITSVNVSFNWGPLYFFFFFFLENIGQKKVIHSKGFVILTFKSSRVLLLKSKRAIRRCLGCRKKKVKYRSSRRMVYLGRDIFLPILIEYLLQEPSLCWTEK